MSDGGLKVVGLDGGARGAPGQPDEEVVASLEGLLERARCGEVLGVLWVARVQSGCVSHFVGRLNAEAIGAVDLEALRLKLLYLEGDA